MKFRKFINGRYSSNLFFAFLESNLMTFTFWKTLSLSNYEKFIVVTAIQSQPESLAFTIILVPLPTNQDGVRNN